MQTTQNNPILKKLAEKRKTIKRLASNDGVYITSSLGDMAVYPKGWEQLLKTNVKQRLCSLDCHSTDVTCCNVKFEEGGYIEPHTHDREEVIFCADGQYYDPVNKLVLLPGHTQTIPPGQLHAGRSDYCLLFVTWRPKFEKVIHVPDDDK